MDLFSDLITAVQSDLTVGDESTLYPLATVKLALNRAYRRVGGMFRWPETEDAKKTSSVISQEYYDYPDTWRPDSVWKLEVDNVDYGDPLVFKDYIYEKENNLPSRLTKIWSNQWRRFFIYPVPTTTGNFNISIWGQKVVDQLVNLTDTTIFSYSMPEVNEAIVMEAVVTLKLKGQDKSDFIPRVGDIRSIEAKQIVIAAWEKIRQEQSKYEKTTPQWDVPDFFRPNSRGATRTGDFD